MKDKKELPAKKPQKAAALPDSPVEEPKLGPKVGVEYGSRSCSGSGSGGDVQFLLRQETELLNQLLDLLGSGGDVQFIDL